MYLSIKDYKIEHYLNSVKDIKHLMRKLSKESDQCILEATGNYGVLFLYLLSENGYRVSMVNSKQITVLGGLKESLQVLPIRDKKSMSIINHTAEFLSKKIKYLEADILVLAEEKFEEQYKLLTSIKRIGGTTAPL